MSAEVRKFIRDFFLIAAISGVLVMMLFANPVRLYERGGLALLWAWCWRTGLGTAILWQGNAYVSNIPERWAGWTEAPVRRFFLSVGFTIVFTLAAWVLISWLFQITDHGWDLAALIRDMHPKDFVTPLLITLFISIFMHGRGFLLGWKETLVEAERLKKEHIAARFEALQNQVNPHFLFNSLNVLTTLVHKDADQAEQFIRRLSDVYRYILESRDKEVVPLTEELAILRAYLFLVEVRFGASLQTDIRIPETVPGHLAPLTLQMLVENALKHNEASKARPLRIEIFEEAGYLTVRNNLQPKNTLPESTGIGLANIQARYQILAGEELRITNHDGYFSVRVPILKTA